jgi:hypothetical protein
LKNCGFWFDTLLRKFERYSRKKKMEKKINSARFIDQTLPFYMELRGGGGDGWKKGKRRE